MLTLKDVRYWCFRFKTEAEGGAEAEGAPEGLREQVEAHKVFSAVDGWLSFGALWDVVPVDYQEWDIVVRDASLWDIWQAHCESVAKEFPQRAAAVQELVRDSFEESKEIDVVLSRD